MSTPSNEPAAKTGCLPFGLLLFVFIVGDGIHFWPAVCLYALYKLLVEP